MTDRDDTTLDAPWRAAWRGVAPHLRPEDVVLVPDGDWPRSAARLRPYRGAITIDSASVLFLHKSQLAAIRKPDLARVVAEWQCVFANNVFVCFSRRRLVALDRRWLRRRYTRRLDRYLHSARLKRRDETAFFLHLPKTAGTSLWDALRRKVPSHLYYDSIESFLHNPPALGEYDLVGGHVPAALLLPHLRPQDYIVSVLREPTDRFRAAFLHARRPREDPGTFTRVMRLLREAPLERALALPDIVMEMRQQMLMLGFGYDRPYDAALDADIERQARQLALDRRHLFGTMDRLDEFGGRVAARLGLRPVRLGRLNTTDRNTVADALEEFERLWTRVDDANRDERHLYHQIRDLSAGLPVRVTDRRSPALPASACPAA